MFDKSYFEKEFPKQLEHFKKNAKQEAKISFVLGGNQHVVLKELEDVKDGWISFWIEDSDYKSAKQSSVLMISRYDQIRQILFSPTRSETTVGFRGAKT